MRATLTERKLAAIPSADVGGYSRLVYIDNLRVLLISLVVLHHLAVTYAAVGDWYYKEPQTGETATLVLLPFIATNQAFFMGFFFLISAYLTPGSLERKGLSRFLVDRVLRLGIPLAFYTLVINPVLEAILAVHVRGFSGSYGAYLAQSYGDTLGLGPMWFVEALLLFTAAFVLVRVVRGAAGPKSAAVQPSIRATSGLALSLGLTTFLVRIAYPVGDWIPVLHLQPAHATQYVTLFAIGILASRHTWQGGLSPRLVRFWSWTVPLASLGAMLALVFGGSEHGLAPFDGGLHWQSLVTSLWEQSYAVGIIILLLAWFGLRFDRQGPLLRAAAADSYTVYIIHPLVVVVFALAMRDVPLPALAKFAVLAPVALITCFASAHLVRRLPFTRRIL